MHLRVIAGTRSHCSTMSGMTTEAPPVAARHATHWPGLDGLRGVAALAVVAFHLGYSAISPNGYTGVDVFFALSGFLITSLLLREHRRHQAIDLRRFYIRRVLRLYPALLALCLGVVALGLVTGEEQVVPAAAAALLYLANWWIYTGHEAPLLEHTWTLAIEEHFYVVWPILLILLLQRRLRWLGVAGVVAAVVAVSIDWGQFDAVRGTYLRGSAIVWGSVLAGLVHVATPRARHALATAAPWLGWPALAALIAILLWPRSLEALPLTGPLGIVGWASVVLVAAVVAAPASPVVRWLGWAPLTWAGRRSYGIYLYHFPILSLLRHHVPVGPEAVRLMLGVALTLAVAEASYRWLELPFLRLKSRFAPD